MATNKSSNIWIASYDLAVTNICGIKFNDGRPKSVPEAFLILNLVTLVHFSDCKHYLKLLAK